MAQRICSLCGTPYTDETGHNYDLCASLLEERVKTLTTTLQDAQDHLEEARGIQAADWWKERVFV